MADDIDDAADYALGLMTADERRSFLRRLAREPGLADEVAAWQQRLAPLALALEPVAPPQALRARVLRAIDGGQIAANDGGPGWWRPLAIAASAVAAVLGGVAIERRVAPQPSAPAVAPASAGGMLLASLNSAGNTPGLFVRYDRETDRLTVVPVGLSADEAHSLELWLIRGKDTPKPLWLVDPARASNRKIAERIGGDVTLAISREPRGGSPTGLPTGPVLYSGTMVRMPIS